MRFLACSMMAMTLMVARPAYGEDLAPSDQLAARYPKGSIASVESAVRALAEAEKARASMDAQLRAGEQACYPKFFTNACLEAARERHRLGMTQIRQVELEASSFKRRARLMQREQDVNERLFGREESAQVADDRVKRHEEKLKALQEEEARRAPQRRRNIADYEKKQREAEQRQQELAKRKAGKEPLPNNAGQ